MGVENVLAEFISLALSHLANQGQTLPLHALLVVAFAELVAVGCGSVWLDRSSRAFKAFELPYFLVVLGFRYGVGSLVLAVEKDDLGASRFAWKSLLVFLSTELQQPP